MFVNEIFESFHGEINGHHQGRIVTFIRLSGCNLKCTYCDTKETWDPLSGRNISPLTVLNEVRELGHKHICLTGGEPLLYKNDVLELLHLLWYEGYYISVETNGTIDISPFFRYVDSFIIDYKIHLVPSGVKRITTNFNRLRSTDIVKFVVESKEDAIQSFFVKEQLESLFPEKTNPICAFSPIMPKFTHSGLAKLLITHKVRNAVLSLQIHKIIGLK